MPWMNFSFKNCLIDLINRQKKKNVLRNAKFNWWIKKERKKGKSEQKERRGERGKTNVYCLKGKRGKWPLTISNRGNNWIKWGGGLLISDRNEKAHGVTRNVQPFPERMLIWRIISDGWARNEKRSSGRGKAKQTENLRGKTTEINLANVWWRERNRLLLIDNYSSIGRWLSITHFNICGFELCKAQIKQSGKRGKSGEGTAQRERVKDRKDGIGGVKLREGSTAQERVKRG